MHMINACITCSLILAEASEKSAVLKAEIHGNHCLHSWHGCSENRIQRTSKQ